MKRSVIIGILNNTLAWLEDDERSNVDKQCGEHFAFPKGTDPISGVGAVNAFILQLSLIINHLI
jgi:hypothetical protein